MLLCNVMDASSTVSLMPPGADLSGEPSLMGARDGADGEIEQACDDLALAEVAIGVAPVLALAPEGMIDHNPAPGIWLYPDMTDAVGMFAAVRGLRC